MKLPPPVKYEELQRESMSTSNPHIALRMHALKLWLALSLARLCHTAKFVEHSNLHHQWCCLAAQARHCVLLMFFGWYLLRPGSAVSLKPELFEGLRFDFTKPLNQNFQLCHRYAALCSSSVVLCSFVSLAHISAFSLLRWALRACLLTYTAFSWATSTCQRRTISL